MGMACVLFSLSPGVHVNVKCQYHLVIQAGTVATSLGSCVIVASLCTDEVWGLDIAPGASRQERRCCRCCEGSSYEGVSSGWVWVSRLSG